MIKIEKKKRKLIIHTSIIPKSFNFKIQQATNSHQLLLFLHSPIIYHFIGIYKSFNIFKKKK